MKSTDYLFDAAKHKIPAVCAVYGKDSFLKFHVLHAIREQVLADGDAEFSLSRFEGKTAEIEKVLTEVATQSMFGGGQRLVWIEDADPFLTKCRDLLEAYVDKPSKNGVLLLELESFPSNTRLYKKLEQVGFLVDCAPPPDRDIPKWLVRWAKHYHKITCNADAAAMLVDLIGAELGLLDQELTRLSLYVPPKGAITAEIVRENVGGQRIRKIYEILSHTLAGKPADAIRTLDNLLMLDKKAEPIGILAYISKALRQLGAAALLFRDAKQAGKPISVTAALEAAGVERPDQSVQHLNALGSRRAEKLLHWLLQTDLAMKGASSYDPRLALETLLIRVAEPRLK